MTNFRPFTLAVAAAALLAAPTAQAASIQYITEGIFTGGDGPPGSSFIKGGVQINYVTTGLQEVDASPSSNVSFGQFDTSLTTSTTNVDVVADFTLRILQVTPTPTGSPIVEFMGALTGTLRIDNSGAYVQFDAPLSATVPSDIGDILYSIVSADDGFAGRVNINPRTTNGGLTNISGRITAVPEPSAFALLGLAAPAALLVRRRRAA